MDEKEDTERHFSLDMLRQLFQFKEKTLCETHETFKCQRCKDGRQIMKSQALLYGDASTSVNSLWNEISYTNVSCVDGTTTQMQNSETTTTTYCVPKLGFLKFHSFFNILATDNLYAVESSLHSHYSLILYHKTYLIIVSYIQRTSTTNANIQSH